MRRYLLYLFCLSLILTSCSKTEEERVENIAKGYLQSVHPTTNIEEIKYVKAYTPYDTPKYMSMCETLTMLNEKKEKAFKDRDSLKNLLAKNAVPKGEIEKVKRYIRSGEAECDTIILRTIRFKKSMDKYVETTKKQFCGYVVECKGSYQRENGETVKFGKTLLLDTAITQVEKSINMSTEDYKVWHNLKKNVRYSNIHKNKI